MMGETRVRVVNIHKYGTKGMIMLQTDFFTGQIHLQHASITWWDGKRNTGYPHIISSADYISMLTLCVQVCVCVWVCVLVCVVLGRSETPVQSVFNFPEMKLHGRAITGALDCRKVILEIINRPQSVWMCKCMESACVSMCVSHACI